MANHNSSPDNWKPITGKVVAPYGANKNSPDLPELMPEETVKVLIENGADIQLTDQEKRTAEINGEITEDMVQPLIVSFFGNEYWEDVKHQPNLADILIGAFGCFEMEATLVEQEGVLQSIKIRGTANLETVEGIN